MKVLVSDTSVIVDLERGQFLEACFALPVEFVVPDLLYRRELADAGGPNLCRLGLQVESLTSAEVIVAQETRGAHPKLSLPDAYAFALARARSWALLTGDGELRALARTGKIEMHGVLWVLDQLHGAHIVKGTALVAGLAAISEHPRCRLPRADIQARLALYGKSKPHIP